MDTVNKVIEEISNVSISGGDAAAPQQQQAKKPKVDKKALKAAADAEAGPLEV